MIKFYDKYGNEKHKNLDPYYKWIYILYLCGKSGINLFNIKKISILEPNSGNFISGFTIIKTYRIVPAHKNFNTWNLFKYSIINFFKNDR